MENITLGQIATVLAFVVGLFASVKYLKKVLTDSIDTTFDKKLEPIKKEIKEVKDETRKYNLSSIKTDLINLMELADKDIISVEQKMRAHELYDYYCEHGGNSYVHDKWEDLKKEGKI